MIFFEYNLVEDLKSIKLQDPNVNTPRVVNCLNPHSFVTALTDNAFHQALVSSDYLLPDGVGITMALKQYKGLELPKIAGEDFHFEILGQLNQVNGKLFYLGSSAKVLSLIEDRIHKEYPNIQVKTHSPSYCTVFSDEENQEMVNLINDFAPDALMVGMTAPKQEKWVNQNLDQFTSPMLIGSIGAVFDFFAGTIKRAPRWAIQLRLEWLYRFLQEPKRMWKRNFVSTPKYLKYVKSHQSEI